MHEGSFKFLPNIHVREAELMDDTHPLNVTYSGVCYRSRGGVFFFFLQVQNSACRKVCHILITITSQSTLLSRYRLFSRSVLF